jgi:hypothetical protein
MLYLTIVQAKFIESGYWAHEQLSSNRRYPLTPRSSEKRTLTGVVVRAWTFFQGKFSATPLLVS